MITCIHVHIYCCDYYRVCKSNSCSYNFNPSRTLHLVMKTATYGSIREFEVENKKISLYLECEELYFTTNEIANLHLYSTD